MQRGKFRSKLIIAVAACSLLVAASVLAAPIIVRINDVPNAAPVVTVIGAQKGYDIYTGPEIVTPGVEDGAVVTLFGVDQAGEIPELGWRFSDPRDPDSLPPYWVPDPENPGEMMNVREFVLAVDIVWLQHDTEGPFFNGDLQICFNSALPGKWYLNPGVFNEDQNAGFVTNNYVTVYEDDTVVVQFKPHTYVAKKK